MQTEMLRFYLNTFTRTNAEVLTSVYRLLTRQFNL